MFLWYIFYYLIPRYPTDVTVDLMGRRRNCSESYLPYLLLTNEHLSFWLLLGSESFHGYQLMQVSGVPYIDSECILVLGFLHLVYCHHILSNESRNSTLLRAFFSNSMTRFRYPKWTYSLLYSFEVISQGGLYTRQHHSLRLFSLPRATFKNNNKPHIEFSLCPLYPPGGFCLLERMATSLPGSSKSYSNRASPSGERFALQRRGFICRKPSNHTVVKSKLWLYQTSRRFGCVPSIVITPSKSPLGRRIRQSRKWCRCCGAYCFTLPYKCERPKWDYYPRSGWHHRYSRLCSYTWSER